MNVFFGKKKFTKYLEVNCLSFFSYFAFFFWQQSTECYILTKNKNSKPTISILTLDFQKNSLEPEIIWQHHKTIREVRCSCKKRGRNSIWKFHQTNRIVKRKRTIRHVNYLSKGKVTLSHIQYRQQITPEEAIFRKNGFHK